jgi:hypothetical protein
VLAECEKIYRREVPNYALNSLNSITDAAAFFSGPSDDFKERPVLGNLRLNQLPKNLKIVL